MMPAPKVPEQSLFPARGRGNGAADEALSAMALTRSYRRMTNPELMPSRDIAVLLEVMKRLREGCPWDKVQTFDTIAPYTIEEAYEVASAIADKDFKALPGELGDLLFQVVFHARMAEEEGRFDFGTVVEAVTAKMIRRHPHVFGGEQAKADAGQKDSWEKLKAGERAQGFLAGGLEFGLRGGLCAEQRRGERTDHGFAA